MNHISAQVVYSLFLHKENKIIFQYNVTRIMLLRT